ncbi:hypothetical protein HHK36_025299 [Tetracentron sinense]|uniref:Bifunctional inhibitor/plant lipid transfer protein/seed storage helical domain-containing protein n=1 Tax=Tetracentron sinense TaxID=13715 RepID=A0A834YSG9_TETSI|nr:hypothetical protein HHK36_025299 [Tetracentron sinense]
MNMGMKVWAWNGIVVVALAILVSECQAQDTSCLNQLLPCLNYLNGTNDPPSSCCDPLKSVIKSNPQCLCSMISSNSTNAAEQAGINVTEAQQLPGKCGESVNPLACLASSPNTKNTVPNSANGLSFVSMIWVAALSVTVQILFASCIILA